MGESIGFVRAGFEPVGEAFQANFTQRGEVGAACAVVVDGELVVDLWGGVADPRTGRPWTEDTMVVMFSTTKGVSSMALAHAHSRGLFDYDAAVADYWPEFAAGGKEEVTVRQLLSHQAGLAAIDQPLRLGDLADPDRVARVIAAQEPAWTPGEQHGYHGLTLGWYESELLRRVDPERRTIGRYFADEIATPLGLDLHIGLPDEVPGTRLARILGDWYRTRMLAHLDELPREFVRRILDPRTLTARAFSNPRVVGIPPRYNTRELLGIELPAANGVGTARSVARAYGALATGGRHLGIRPQTLTALTEAATPPSRGTFDEVLRTETTFSLGYCKPWPGFEFGSARAFGTPGAGGSFGFADPELGLGFCYLMNRMGFRIHSDPREVALREAVRACLS